MKLIILRHAKSSWADHGLDDHDRPLAPRGMRAAMLIGQWLATAGHQPKSVICSTATRAHQTWKKMSSYLPCPDEVRYTSDLYHAEVEQIWNTVRQGQQSPLLIVGHNPGLGAFARSAVQQIPDRHEFLRYPTAAVTVCVFPDKNWWQVAPRTGQLVAFTVPRDHS